MKRVSRSDLMDDFLESKGLHRKHIAWDATCLFRAVSEQIYCTQSTHSQILNATINYMRYNRDDFEFMIDENFEDYLQKLSVLKILAGKVEMKAVSKMLDISFVVYKDVGKIPISIGSSSNENKQVVLCCSYDQHYDSVYPRSYLAVTAFCQAIVYEVLYKNVFRMGSEATNAVQKMLHDKNYSRQRRSHLTCTLRLPDHFDMLANPEAQVREAIEQGIPPFPFKVAKALDPDIYRNVEYDAWNEIRKDQIRAELNGTADFQPGDKCLISLEKENNEWYTGHIQHMNPNKGPVTVFVEELGEKCTIPYEQLEILPASRETGKSRLFKGRRFHDYNLSIAINPANYKCHSKSQIGVKTLNGYPKSTVQLGGPNGSVCSKEGNSSFETSNEISNESCNDISPTFQSFCDTQYCGNGSAVMPGVNVAMNTSTTPQLGYRNSEYIDSNSSDCAAFQAPPFYPSGNYDVSSQYATPVIQNGTSFYLPNSMNDPQYGFNQHCVTGDTAATDLPLSDVHTLRFFYNLGLDYYRMSFQNTQSVPVNNYNQQIQFYPSGTMYSSNQVITPGGIPAIPQNGNISGIGAANMPVQNTIMYGHQAPIIMVPRAQGSVSSTNMPIPCNQPHQ